MTDHRAERLVQLLLNRYVPEQHGQRIRGTAAESIENALLEHGPWVAREQARFIRNCLP